MEQKQMNDIFKQSQDQINEVANILEKLTEMVKDNREFIGKNAKLIKELIITVKILADAGLSEDVIERIKANSSNEQPKLYKVTDKDINKLNDKFKS